MVFDSIKERLSDYFGGSSETTNNKNEISLKPILDDNIKILKELFSESADVVIHGMDISGRKCAFIHMEGMINKQDLALSVIRPLAQTEIDGALEADEAFDYLYRTVFCSPDQMLTTSMMQLCKYIMSGFGAFILDGHAQAIIIGVHGFQFRSISEPLGENVQLGSREGFVEVLRINMTMIRRRMKTTSLVFELMDVGEESNTNICLCYLSDKVSQALLDTVRERLKKKLPPNILASRYLNPFLEDKPMSLFSSVGMTERPDTLCGKITEGRIGIIVDGSPQVLIVPYLFSENFQMFDDYTEKPVYATFTRSIRCIAFLIALFLPAVYVAAGTYHNEILTASMLKLFAKANSTTPYGLLTETLIIHIVFEIMREAALRMPKTVAGAISIAGAVVIGEAAISAGLVGAPTVLVVSITAVCAYAAKNLYEPISVLRIVFIILGGTLGIFGISAATVMLITNICAAEFAGIPFTAPLSPFRLKSMRDFLARIGWKTLGRKTIDVDKMPGSANLRK